MSEVIERILARTTPDPESGCIRWTGTHNHKGYGFISVHSRARAVHRVMYEAVIGEIPAGLEIDHVLSRGCVHRDCVNPEHLEAVTHRENIRRASPSHGQGENFETCKRGHYRTPENTLKEVRNGRVITRCNTCLHSTTDCLTCGKTVTRQHMPKHVRTFHQPKEASA